MKKFFEKRITGFREQDVKLAKRSKTFTAVRIFVFIFFLALWIFLLSEAYFSEFVISLLLFPFIFGYLVNRHKKVNYRQQFYRQLILINEEEINRLHFKPVHFSNGSSYINEDHPYTSDLDIFGSKSLFHFINRTATPSGEEILVSWLSSPSSAPEILQRQQAVAELTQQIEWRQEIQATELEIGSKESINFFLEWLQKAGEKINTVIIYLLPLVVITAIVLWFTGLFSIYIPLVLLIINGFIIFRHASKTHELSEVTDKGLAILKKYRHIINLIEDKQFETQKLKKIRNQFHDQDYSASTSLRKLERILEFLNARGNMFYHILNFIFLIDLHLIHQAQLWRSGNQKFVSGWFNAIGELEALCSFAGYKYADEALHFPEIEEKPYFFEAVQLGHPLIAAHERVDNDFKIEGKGAVYIITGSNMSGKSTFLRTVCINAVLAYAGAPVSAQKLRLSIMHVFTNMRTHDDLEAHVSSFYAELKRIRQLLDKLRREENPVLYVLDEVLKGTNSHDRHAGAIALARQLHEKNCMGMISTHDLELGELAKEAEDIKNFSFNSDIIEDKILFDYKIHPGVCRSFNASKLMEQMGIEINKQK